MVKTILCLKLVLRICKYYTKWSINKFILNKNYWETKLIPWPNEIKFKHYCIYKNLVYIIIEIQILYL